MNDKVIQLFREWVGDGAARLEGACPADVRTRLTAALQGDPDAPGTAPVAGCDELGFHLLDWQHEAAFLVGLVLFPERFTDQEIREGVDSLLIHVPAHILEAARLGGYPIENIFADGDGTK